MSPSWGGTELVAEAPSFETPPPLPPKGGGRLGRVSGGLVEVLVASKMPSGNPRRGFPAKSLPQEAFSTLLRLPKATKAAGASPPHPYKPFEKGLSENFTCLHPTCVEGPALAERKKAACPVRSRTAVRVLSCPATDGFPLRFHYLHPHQLPCQALPTGQQHRRIIPRIPLP